MPIVVPPSSPATGGQPDSYFVSEVRRILRDQPVWFAESQPTDGATGVLNPGSKPFRLQRAPVIQLGVQLSAPGAPVGGYQIDFDDSGGVPGVGHVNVISDTGEIVFNTAPLVGTLAVTYQAVRYSDVQIRDALYDGLNLLWPEIWKWSTDTSSILVSPTQYEYPLPAVFQDNRCVLRTVEFAPPSGIVRYFKTSLWHQVEDPVNPILVFSRIPPVASTVRLGYVKPLAALSETPVIALNLPVYYAVARLCLDQETMRGRSDDISALTGEGALAPSVALNTADYWLQQFSTQLTRLSLDEPTRRSIQNRAVERLGLSDIWTDLA